MKVIKFYADWCGPCKALVPMFEELEAEHPEVEFEHVNIDEEQERALNAGVRGVPTVHFLKDGDLTNSLVGVYPKNEYKKSITSLKS